MAELTSKQRDQLPSSAFVFPGERRYPIHDRAHGTNALARVTRQCAVRCVSGTVTYRPALLKNMKIHLIR